MNLYIRTCAKENKKLSNKSCIMYGDVRCKINYSWLKKAFKETGVEKMAYRHTCIQTWAQRQIQVRGTWRMKGKQKLERERGGEWNFRNLLGLMNNLVNCFFYRTHRFVAKKGAGEDWVGWGGWGIGYRERERNLNKINIHQTIWQTWQKRFAREHETWNVLLSG